LFTWSEDFSNAAWSKSASSISSNVTTAPNGTLTADKLIEDTANTSHTIFQTISISASTNYNYSVYLKAAERFRFRIRFTGFSGAQDATVNLNTQTTSLGTLTSVGNGWFRFAWSVNSGAGGSSTLVAITLQDDSGNSTYLGNGTSGAFIWGAQLVEGTSALDYFPTTDRQNVPRIDFRNADGTLSSCGRLLLEPQRTNVTLQSETITAGTGTTVTLDTTSAPTGLNTADKLVEDTSTGLHFTAFGGALGGTLDSSVYCVIIFAKAAGRTRFTMFDNGQVSAGASTFDLSNGTVISGTGRIENYGSGWYRCTIFPAKSTSTTANVQIRIVDTGTNTSYTGNGTSGLFLWGKQIEPNATYPTTYIPTTTAAVTRLQDTASKTGVSSLIGQAEGTIFFEADIQKRNASEFYFGISVGSALGNALYVQQPTSGNLQILIRKTGNADGAITVLNANWTAGFNKVAVAYTSTTAEVFINGVSRGTTSFLSAPACNQITVGSRIDVPGTLVGAGGYAQAALFIRRLTNAELAAITTL
jgi:hypothetical protein